MRNTRTWRHKDGSVRVDHMDAQEGDYYGFAPVRLVETYWLMDGTRLLEHDPEETLRG